LDAIVTGFADRLGDLANLLRKQQNGLVRSYALSMVTGALVILATLLAVTLS
jgi:NADH-quinone oxidoreductase subunit L